MSVTQAFETTATVATPRSLQLDESLPLGAERVRVIVLRDDVSQGEHENSDTEINEKEWLEAVSSNPAFDFLNNPAEEIYTWEDGKPFDEE